MSVQVVRHGKSTIAFGAYYHPDYGVILFAGTAQRNPIDEEDATKGHNLAIKNAYDNLGRSIGRRMLKEAYTKDKKGKLVLK